MKEKGQDPNVVFSIAESGEFSLKVRKRAGLEHLAQEWVFPAVLSVKRLRFVAGEGYSAQADAPEAHGAVAEMQLHFTLPFLLDALLLFSAIPFIPRNVQYQPLAFDT